MAVNCRRGGPRPLQTKVTTVGGKEIYYGKPLVWPFLVHKLLGPRPPPFPPLLQLPCILGIPAVALHDASVASLSHATATAQLTLVLDSGKQCAVV